MTTLTVIVLLVGLAWAVRREQERRTRKPRKSLDEVNAYYEGLRKLK